MPLLPVWTFLKNVSQSFCRSSPYLGCYDVPRGSIEVVRFFHRNIKDVLLCSVQCVISGDTTSSHRPLGFHHLVKVIIGRLSLS
jgi:hypothetical protein